MSALVRAERILDLCAAPGGKATALAGAQPALVVAADISSSRASVTATTVARLGAASVVTVVADGTSPPWRAGSFDRVLVDAPCSGLGVLRRRPDARWRIQPADIDRLAALQRRLLGAAVPLVRPGGVLVYSVCTLTGEETSGIDRWLARTFPGLVALPRPPPPGLRRGAARCCCPRLLARTGCTSWPGKCRL